MLGLSSRPAPPMSYVSRRAFTLIELLGVVFILALLVALMLPQVISLADLTVTAGGKPSEMVALRDGKLVWRGALAAEPSLLEVAYTAVGKGLYELSVPPGGILDQLDVSLEAKGSDVRLLELSLQPTKLARQAGSTTYTWAYQRLLFGQPVRLDVLGIAPIDRLGELTWLARSAC